MDIFENFFLGFESDPLSTYAASYFSSVPWPDDLLKAFMDESFLKMEKLPDTQKCHYCDRELTIDYSRKERGWVYFHCPLHGEQLTELNPSYTLSLDAMAKFAAEDLRLFGSVQTLVPNRLWDLGRRPNQNPFGRAFMTRGVEWPDASRVFSSLTRGSGLCLGLGYDNPAPDWMPKEICYVPFHTQLQITQGKLWLDVRKIERLVGDQKRVRGEAVLDERGVPMPAKIDCSGNEAIKNQPLKKIWQDYLRRYNSAKRVEIVERETRDLDWSQNQRAGLIGMDKAQYSRLKTKNKAL